MPCVAHQTELTGVLIIEPRVFADNRGHFFESYNTRDFEAATGQRRDFVQDNQSQSRHGVVRGLHYQIKRPQAKLIRAIQGEVFDVAVDLRRESPTFGRWIGVVLSADNRRQLWIPEGFAHGFAALSPTAEVLYKATDYWVPDCDRAVLWSDPAIGIRWPLIMDPIVSQKDAAAPRLADAELEYLSES